MYAALPDWHGEARMHVTSRSTRTWYTDVTGCLPTSTSPSVDVPTDATDGSGRQKGIW